MREEVRGTRSVLWWQCYQSFVKGNGLIQGVMYARIPSKSSAGGGFASTNQAVPNLQRQSIVFSNGMTGREYGMHNYRTF